MGMKMPQYYIGVSPHPEKARGLNAEAVGPFIFTYLDGEDAKAMEDVELDTRAITDGELLVFARLDENYSRGTEARQAG